jgi:purine catabolism regulator
VGITVGELIELRDLRTWVHAGRAGLGREVSWAHVCELADPTEWLGRGELVLTTGLGIPAEPARQRAYVERLADAGLSGVSLGHRMYAPEITREMCDAAEERALPLLFTSYEVPFTAVVRAVAEANRSEEHARVLQSLRVYETARHVAVTATGAELLGRLADTVGCRLYVVDPERGSPLISGSEAPGQPIVAALAAANAERQEPLPAVQRLTAGPCRFLAVAVPASRPAAMVALQDEAAPVDLAVLRHVAGVAALEIEREMVERERRRRLGAELLAGLLDGRLPAEAAAPALAERGLGDEPRVLAAFRTDQAGEAHPDVHLRLDDRGIPHLLLRRASLLLAMLRDEPESIAALRDELEPQAALGLSDPLGRLARAAEAQREAVWARHAAQGAGRSLVRYGEEAPSFFMPRVLGDAQRAVEEILGPLLAYDAAHDAQLVTSLRAFLSHNRSWKETASALHLHKQTLVYRMRRVEELTGRRLDDTGNVAEFWLALKTAEYSAQPELDGERRTSSR